MAQGLKLPLFSGVCIKHTVGKIKVEYAHICGPGAHSSTIFLGQIWPDKDFGRFSAPLLGSSRLNIPQIMLKEFEQTFDP